MPLRWSLGKMVGQFYKYAAPTALVFPIKSWERRRPAGQS